MRLGICGGTFDPVHNGHLLLAEQCREQCRLDEVWFIPTSDPPHKRGVGLTPGPLRAEMLELATAGHQAFRVSDMELLRQGLTFTVDTLRELRAQGSGRELFFLIGADSLIDLPKWREPREIGRLATIVVVNRGGQPLPELASLAPALGEDVVSCMEVVTIPGIDLSATDIRRRVREGLSIRFMVPPAVEQYIAAEQLYVGGAH